MAEAVQTLRDQHYCGGLGHCLDRPLIRSPESETLDRAARAVFDALSERSIPVKIDVGAGSFRLRHATIPTQELSVAEWRLLGEFVDSALRKAGAYWVPMLGVPGAFAVRLLE